MTARGFCRRCRPCSCSRLLPLPGRAHAGLQRRGRHARLVRQGAGRGALSAGVLEHLRDRRCWSPRFCLLLGYPLGFLIATTTPAWATLGFIFVLLPLWTSVLVRTYAWMVLLGRNGVFNRWLIDGGIISDPLPLLHNFTGVLIGMVHVLLPYMVLPIYGAVRRLDPGPRRRGPRAGRLGLAHLLAHLPAAHPERHLCRRVLVFVLSLGFFITPGPAGRRPGDHDRRADRAAGARDAELAVRRGALGRAAGRHASPSMRWPSASRGSEATP